jgi:SOS response regulatory protein OraA/RecX
MYRTRTRQQPQELSSSLVKAWSYLLKQLALRDHSELELKNKLERKFEKATVSQTILRAIEENLIKEPEKLAESVSQSLLRRGKGSRNITMQLKKRGLPNVKVDESQELQQALRLLSRSLRLEKQDWLRDKTKSAKVYRFLTNRGFSTKVIISIVYCKFETEEILVDDAIEDRSPEGSDD